MRLSDLRDKTVRTLDGERLGRVHDIQCEKGRITALMCGPGSLIERWTAKGEGRRIPWECVRKVEAKQIVVTPDPSRRLAKKSGAIRSRLGTRPPSGKRSKR
jgi:sporulation protein YlmC with PRC-barrel domain